MVVGQLCKFVAQNRDDLIRKVELWDGGLPMTYCICPKVALARATENREEKEVKKNINH
jgi:hypothetical protein